MMTFDEVAKRGDWRPIYGCPGRFVLRGVSSHTDIFELLGSEIEVQKFDRSNAKDTAFVARLDDGGLISYSRPDGTWVHTLCTRDGFDRKIRQLEIIMFE
ncbi:MAG TPA: hypothetical protein PKM58_06460 [Pyrinomonadaceae bacterium]|nr:hypothetical protein [Pyrinomonadaceae bacterium]